jgi:hypothetical protein
VKSNLKAVAVAVAMAAGAGCAHGTAPVNHAREVRGMARVGKGARALIVGPARLVHATGEKAVRWFVAKRVTGDDRDCVAAPAPGALSEAGRAQLTIGAGHVLCAAVARGATDVMWHELSDGGGSLSAHR